MGLIHDGLTLAGAIEKKCLKTFFANRGVTSPHFNEADFEKILEIVCAVDEGVGTVCQALGHAQVQREQEAGRESHG